MHVLLSIRPKYCEAILTGKKKYEFRRTIFKNNDVKKIYLYRNSDIKRIVGSFLISHILMGSPKEIWEKCKKQSGITKREFFDYFKGSDIAYAIRIKKTHKLKRSIDPYTKVKNFVPPQSFHYIKSIWPKA
jgi:type I restriction enzyme S subunit